MTTARHPINQPLAWGPWGEPGRLLSGNAASACTRNCDLRGGLAVACDRSCGMSAERLQKLSECKTPPGGRS